MAKLVIGRNSQRATPAIVRDVAPAHYIEKTVDVNGLLVNGSASIIDLTGVTKLSGYALAYAYYKNTALTGAIDMSSIIQMGNSSNLSCCSSMFYGCTGITSIDLSSLTTISGSCMHSMFYGCTNLVSADLSSLSDIAGSGCQYMFRDCGALTTVKLDSLETINGNSGANSMFDGCTSLQTLDLGNLVSTSNGSEMMYMCTGCSSLQNVNLKKLQSTGYRGLYSAFNGCTSLVTMAFQSFYNISSGQIFYNAFRSCTSLQTLWFYAATSFGTQTNQFNQMLQGCTGVTVHFPIAIQSTIGSWSDVTNGFGGTSTTVSFDLVTSLTGVDTNTYTRSEKDSTSTATAWTYNDTLYYTSGVSNHTAGVNEPTVGTTIYSDASCTTVVTTVASIA